MDEQFTGIFIPVKYLDTDKAEVLKIMDDLEDKGYIEVKPTPYTSTG